MRIKVLSESFDVLPVGQALFHDYVHDRVEQCDIGAGVELQPMLGMTEHAIGARINRDERAAPLGKLFEVRRRDRVITNGITADGDGDVRVLDLVERRSHSAGADILHQCRNRGRMTKTRAVIDIVMSERFTD